MSTPMISAVTPSSGPAGTVVVVTGSGLASVTGVSLGATNLTAWEALSDTILRFTVPTPFALGVEDIGLTYGGNLVLPNGFDVTTPPPSRNPAFWPGAVLNPFNVSIKTGATYVDAKLPARTAAAAGIEAIVLNMDASQAVVPVYQNEGQHDTSPGGRCSGSLGLFSPSVELPYNQQLLIPDSGLNYPGVFIAADGLTRWEGGNIAHCTVGGKFTAGHIVNSGTIEDASALGASGGSGLSTLLGTLRYGELTHGTNGTDGMIRHVLRINLNGHTDLSSAGSGYRWPAIRADGGYNDPSSNNYYGGSVPECVEGSRLAIPQSLSLASLGLTSAPGKKFAWTLQNYGAYVCNDSVASVFPICIEESAVGSVTAEFQSLYGYPFHAAPGANAWADDMAIILSHFAVVDNDTATSIGGVGTPLQPAAPAVFS